MASLREISLLCLLSLYWVVGTSSNPTEPPGPVKEPDAVTTSPADVSSTTIQPKITTTEPSVSTPVTTTNPVQTTAKSGDLESSTPVISFGVDTGEKLDRWGEAVKDTVKKPSDIIKESVDIFREGAKLGSELGEAAVSQGIVDLGMKGVATMSNLGKMGINVTTIIANNTLGLIHKIGDMMPVGGKLVKGGVNIGRKGLSVAKALGENLLDNLVWLSDSGFGWLRNTASTSKTYLNNKTDTIATSINQGIDSGTGRLGQILSAGISKLPFFRVNASLHLG